MPSVRGSKLPLVSTSPVASSSITVAGGTRPPIPTTVGAGRGLPEESTVTEGPVSSVVVRLALSLPPGRNSATRPPTTTASPTATVGATEVNTNSASEVAWSASGRGSWRKKPLAARAVTTPVTPETSWPFLGERWPAPWRSWIAVAATTSTVSVQLPVCGSGSSLAASTSAA